MSSLRTINLTIRQYCGNSTKSAKNLNFLVDTGTDKTLVSEDAIRHSNLIRQSLPNPLFINNALNQASKTPVIFQKIAANIILGPDRKEIIDKELLVVKSKLG